MSKALLRKAFQHLYWFENLNEADFSILLPLVHCRRIEKETILFNEGDSGNGVHFVLSGLVKVVRTSEDGREHILRIVQPGETFAEVVLFTGRPYPATAIAATTCDIAFLPTAALETAVKASPELAVRLIHTLAERLYLVQEKVKLLALDNVAERTAAILLALAKEQGQPEKNGVIELPWELTRQELANLVGATRETLARTLSAMKKDGLVDFDDRLIKLYVTKLSHLTR